MTRYAELTVAHQTDFECVPSHQGRLPLRWHWQTAFFPAAGTSQMMGEQPVPWRE